VVRAFFGARHSAIVEPPRALAKPFVVPCRLGTLPCGPIPLQSNGVDCERSAIGLPRRPVCLLSRTRRAPRPLCPLCPDRRSLLARRCS
jgi:hypothetical protein